jgi:hypothetical protein
MLKGFASAVLKRMRSFKITLIGAVITFVLYIPAVQRTIPTFSGYANVFIEVGGMFGTVIALVFSISILSVQRAAETFAPSISELYRQDRGTHIIYFVLVMLCLTSFVLSVDGIVGGLPHEKLFPLLVLGISLSFDLLRLHYNRIGQLMDAGVAVQLLRDEVLKRISRNHQQTSRQAETHLRSLTAGRNIGEASRQKALLEVVGRIHLNNSTFREFLNQRVGDLTEIARKAIARGEVSTAEAAISTLTRITISYLKTREDNLILYPAPNAPLSGIIKSDADFSLDYLYDRLVRINKTAIASKEEIVSIKVISSFAYISGYLMSRSGNMYKLSWSPLGSIGTCVRDAQANGFHDTALRTSRELVNLTGRLSKDNLDYHTYLFLIDRWIEIAGLSLYSKAGAVGNEVLKDLMILPHFILNEKPILLKYILRNLLPKLHELTPLMISNEDMADNPYSPYAMTYERSIGYLVEGGKTLIGKDNADWVNPYSNFIELNEQISSHLRNVAERFDICGSRLIWHFAQTIQFIAEVHLELIANPVTDSKDWLEELVRQVPWYLSTFWAAFKSSRRIERHFAYEVCDTTAKIGMAFYVEGYREVTRSAVNCISSVVSSYSRPEINANQYDVADSLIALWHIRILAESRDDSELVRSIDDEIEKLPIMSGEQSSLYKEALENRKNHLLHSLGEYSPLDDATSLLMKLL